MTVNSVGALGRADEMLTKIFCVRSSNLGRADRHLGEGELADREGDQRCANLVMIVMRMMRVMRMRRMKRMVRMRIIEMMGRVINVVPTW